MKLFKEYLTESKKTYKFKLRVAGELPENFADKLDQAMTKFEVVSISTGKKTPITEKPLDFPQLANCEVTHYDVEVSYPVTAYVLEHYLVNETGTAHANLIVRGEGDPVEEQQMEIADEKAPYEPLLNTEDMGGESAQDQVANNRTMDLLKELEVARKERAIDPVEGITPGESKDISADENTKSTIGS
jgi:hypothetical protein